MLKSYLTEIGWIFIFISAFGFSDYIVNNYFMSEFSRLIYYILVLAIGVFILKKKNKFSLKKFLKL